MDVIPQKLIPHYLFPIFSRGALYNNDGGWKTFKMFYKCDRTDVDTLAKV